MSQRYTSCVDLHLLLFDSQDRVLLGERHNTGYMDGRWHFPSGHLEDGESATSGLLREAAEEVGIEPVSPRLVHVMHHRTDSGRTAFFFAAHDWKGEVTNLEPDRCGGWQFFGLDELPKMIPYAAQALEFVRRGEFYSERGWQEQG